MMPVFVNLIAGELSRGRESRRLCSSMEAVRISTDCVHAQRCGGPRAAFHDIHYILCYKVEGRMHG